MNLMQYLIPRGFMVEITTPLEGDGGNQHTHTHTNRVHHLVMMLGMLRYINKQE